MNSARGGGKKGAEEGGRPAVDRVVSEGGKGRTDDTTEVRGSDELKKRGRREGRGGGRAGGQAGGGVVSRCRVGWEGRVVAERVQKKRGDRRAETSEVVIGNFLFMEASIVRLSENPKVQAVEGEGVSVTERGGVSKVTMLRVPDVTQGENIGAGPGRPSTNIVLRGEEGLGEKGVQEKGPGEEEVNGIRVQRREIRERKGESLSGK